MYKLSDFLMPHIGEDIVSSAKKYEPFRTFLGFDTLVVITGVVQRGGP